MYVCHHCGFISRDENVNYCNNVKCKYYGVNNDPNKENKQKRSLKGDQMTFDYDGDINYPLDKRADSGMNTPNMYGMNMNMNGMSMSSPNTQNMYGINTNGFVAMPNMGSMNIGTKAMGTNDASMNNPIMEGSNKGTPNPNTMLGFATVPAQSLGKLYSPNEAMRAGTVFPSLSMPYNKKILRRG